MGILLIVFINSHLSTVITTSQRPAGRFSVWTAFLRWFLRESCGGFQQSRQRKRFPETQSRFGFVLFCPALRFFVVLLCPLGATVVLHFPSCETQKIAPTYWMWLEVQQTGSSDFKRRLIIGGMSECCTTSNQWKKIAALCRLLITSIRFSSLWSHHYISANSNFTHLYGFHNAIFPAK